MIGYNPGEIEALGVTIDSIAQSAGEKIAEILEVDIVKPMSTIWYSPEAIKLFTNFQTTCAKCGKDVQTAFDAYRDFIQKAGDTWAEGTGGPKPEVQTVSEVSIDVPITDIKEKNAVGSIDMNVELARAKAGELEQIEDKIKTEMAALASDLSASTAFIGAGQADAVESLLTAVSESVHEIFSFLTDGEDSLVGLINAYAQEHESTAETISTSANNATQQVSTGDTSTGQ